MKKKIFVAVVAGTMAMSLAACGSFDAGKTSSNEGEKSYTIGISQFAEHGSLDNCREGFLEGLKEEGIEVVLLNSNPATIMTDKDIADHVYIEPLTLEVVEQLILKEKPDSVLPTLGGQAGLNLAMELEEAGFLKEHNVRLKRPWRRSVSRWHLPR